jgi:hypothetical protein
MTIGEQSKLNSEDCEDISSNPTAPNPAHRPVDRLWERHVKLALAVEQQINRRDSEGRRKPSNRNIAEDVAEEAHVSLPTVQRAYSYYILEPKDLHGANERNWKNKKTNRDDPP